MSDLRKFTNLEELVKHTEALEREAVLQRLKRAKHYASIALSLAKQANDERAEFIETAIAALDDCIDPSGQMEKELRELMEGNDG